MPDTQTPAAPAKASSGLDPKLAALLSWIFAPITSIIFMVMEDMKKDEFVQFNAKESLYYSIVQLVLIPLGIVFMFIPVLNIIMGCVMWILHMALFVGRIVFAVKAYNGEKVVLPLIGEWASK